MKRRPLIVSLGLAVTGCLRLTDSDGTAAEATAGSNRETAASAGDMTEPASITTDALTQLWTGPTYVSNLFAAEDMALFAEGAPEGSNLVGHDPETGDVTFESAAIESTYSTGFFRGSWALTEDTLYFGATAKSDGPDSHARLYAFDRSDGSVRFTYDTPADGNHTNIKYVATSPASPVVLATDSDGRGETQKALVIALDPATGDEQWRVAAPESFANGLAVTDERVYASTDRVRFYEPESGDLRHETDLRSFYGFSLADGQLVTSGDTLVAYDIGNRTVAWEANLPGGTVKTPVSVADDQVYAASDTGWVAAIDAESGATNWSSRLPGAISSAATPPTVGPHFLWLSDDVGRVYLLRPSSGTRALTLSAPENDNEQPRPIGVIGDVVVLGGAGESVAYRPDLPS